MQLHLFLFSKETKLISQTFLLQLKGAKPRKPASLQDFVILTVEDEPKKNTGFSNTESGVFRRNIKFTSVTLFS